MPSKKAPAGGKAAAPKAKSGKGAASDTAAAPTAGGKKANALQKPVQPSKELAAVVGAEPLPRAEVVSKVWAYIKQHDLQNPENRREILADDKLAAVFGTKKVTMFEMNKHLTRHLK
jgi:chromatin remodeling complex protein RSC6